MLAVPGAKVTLNVTDVPGSSVLGSVPKANGVFGLLVGTEIETRVDGFRLELLLLVRVNGMDVAAVVRVFPKLIGEALLG